MIRFITIDDEPLAREGILLNAEEVDFLKPVGEFGNPVKANTFLQKNEVDLMFLDIQMPGMNGLEFLKSLKNPPLTILTTAHSEFALEGFNLNVVDYLLKPVRMDRFLKAVNKAAELFYAKKATQKSDQKASETDVSTVFIKSNRKYIKLKIRDIILVEGMKDYVMVHTENERYPVAMNLKTFTASLPDTTFARINKSYVVNVNHIREIADNHVKIGKENLSIGRSYRDDFLNNHILKKLIDRN